MKKFLLFILLVAAAWYGWKVYPGLVDRRAGHEAIIQNQASSGLTRVRLMVDGQTLVRETIASGQSATIPFKVNNDASFALEFEWQDRMGLMNWRGGMVPKGPMVQRHFFTIDDQGDVVYHAEAKTK